MFAGIVYDLYKLGWVFYALGPQLVLCLVLGYLTARRKGGSFLNWLAAAFFVSLLPLAGAVVMVVLWYQAGNTPGATPAAPAGPVAPTAPPGRHPGPSA